MANTVAAQLYISGVFTSKKAMIENEITAQVGPDLESGTQPSELALRWDNADTAATPGEMDPSNILSPLYGLIGRNTRARLLVGGTALINAEASSWQPDRTALFSLTPARGMSWVDFNARGLLSRLGRWSEPLRSPMYSTLSVTSSLLGYWPLENINGSVLPNPIAGGMAGLAYGSNSTDPGPGGSDEVIQLGSDGTMAGNFITSTASGFQVSWAMQVPNAPAAGLSVFQFLTSNGLTYDFQASTTGPNTIITRNVDGVVLGNFGSTWGGTVTASQWIRVRVKVTVSGSTVTVEPSWYAQDAATVFGITGTFAGTVTGQPTRWNVFQNAATNGAAYGHVMAVSDPTLNLIGTTAARLVFNGYLGELAGDRYVRLMTGAGLTGYIGGSISDTQPMGRQKPGVFLDLLEECMRTDGALIYDEPTDVALMFRTRRNRYFQTSRMDLTLEVNVAPPLKKTLDDAAVINRLTVTNAVTGTQVTKTLSTGAMSILAPPAGVGEYKGSLDVNLSSDALLDDRAGWELNRNTVARPRYKTVTVDLLAHPELITAANAVRPGDLITLAGVEADPVPLHVLSYVHTVGHTTRTIVMSCVPADVWLGGKYDDGVARYTVRSSSTRGTMTTTSTALPIVLTDPLDYWSSTATGYDLVINAERVRVLRMSAVGSVCPADGTFETGGLLGWGGPSGGTFASSNAQAHTGSWSGRLITTGTPTQTYVRCDSFPVVVGASYRAVMWARSATALTNVQMSIDWFDGSGSYLSTSSQTLSLVANTWTQFDATYAAPASAATATCGPTLQSSPATGSAIWVDDLDLLGTGLSQVASVTRSINGVVRAHVAGEAITLYNGPRYVY